MLLMSGLGSLSEVSVRPRNVSSSPKSGNHPLLSCGV